jgi:hypothetical protein
MIKYNIYANMMIKMQCTSYENTVLMKQLRTKRNGHGSITNTRSCLTQEQTPIAAFFPTPNHSCAPNLIMQSGLVEGKVNLRNRGVFSKRRTVQMQMEPVNTI